MNQHDKERKDEREPVRPPIEGDENLPDGAIHHTPEQAPGQTPQREREDKGRIEEELTA